MPAQHRRGYTNDIGALSEVAERGGGKGRSGHEAMFLLFEEFFVELF
jgi:hypothetical protein